MLLDALDGSRPLYNKYSWDQFKYSLFVNDSYALAQSLPHHFPSLLSFITFSQRSWTLSESSRDQVTKSSEWSGQMNQPEVPMRKVNGMEDSGIKKGDEIIEKDFALLKFWFLI